MNLVLDAGALLGPERDDRRVAGVIELGRRSAARLVTTAPVVGQAWRDGARQGRLARALPGIEIRGVTAHDGQQAGELLRSAARSDVVTALLAMAVEPGDQVLTSDPGDLKVLLDARPYPHRLFGCEGSTSAPIRHRDFLRRRSLARELSPHPQGIAALRVRQVVHPPI